MKQLITAMAICGVTFLNGKAQSLKLGDHAPFLDAASVLDGEQSFQYEGKYLVLDFWATWCAPCIAGFSNLNELSRKFKKDPVMFAAISYEEEEKIRKFFVLRKQYRLDAVKLVDKSDTAKSNFFPGKIFKCFQIGAVPKAFLIDPSGTIRWVGHSAQLTDSIIRSILQSDNKTVRKISLVKDSVSIGSFVIKAKLSDYRSQLLMGGPGMIDIKGMQLHKLLAHLQGWHHRQVDISAFADPASIPYVDFNLRGDRRAPRDSMKIVAIQAMREMFGLSITESEKEFELTNLSLTDHQKLLKNAATLNEGSPKSSYASDKNYFTIINYPWTIIGTTVLPEIFPDDIFISETQIPEEVKNRKFDFTIPIKNVKRIRSFLKREYGIEMKPGTKKMPVLVLR